MTAAIVFEFPLGWLFGLPLGAALAFAVWRQRRRGLAASRIAGLAALRGVALLVLVFLAARPVWMTREPPASATRSVMVLMDRSESMSLEERDATRYQQALGFLRERLLPALRAASLPVQAMLFDQGAEPADGAKLSSATPNGKRTNLGGAVAQALGNAAQPPLAVIALTDGIVNESADNTRALTALVDARVPFIGVGFGSDQGVRTLSLREVEAPSIVSTKTAFSIAAQLEMINPEDMPAFDLLLFRDGQMQQKKTRGSGQRLAHLAGELPGDRREAGRPQLRGAIAAAECARLEVRQHAGEHLGARVGREGAARALHPRRADVGLQVHQPGAAQRSDHQDDRPDPHVEAVGVPPERGERGRIDERVPHVARRAGALPGGGAVESAPGGPDPRAAGSAGALLRRAGGRRADDRRAGDV